MMAMLNAATGAEIKCNPAPWCGADPEEMPKGSKRQWLNNIVLQK